VLQVEKQNKKSMLALLEAWPEISTSIGQNACQDNGSGVVSAWIALILTTSPAIILPGESNPPSCFNFV
jgi:hypothetical protein